MSPLWGILLLIVLGAIGLICRKNWAAWRDTTRAMPPQDMREMVLFAALGYFAAWISVAFLITLRRPTEASAFALMATIVLLVAIYRFRQL